MEKGLFRSSVMDRVRSPEQLNDYIRVSSPSVWVVLAAILVLIAALLVWSATATITETVEVEAARSGDAVVFYVPADDADSFAPGMAIRLQNGASGVVRKVDAQNVVSAQEAAAQLANEFVAYSMDLPHWCVRVTCDMKGELPQSASFPATVVTGRVKPLSFLGGVEE